MAILDRNSIISIHESFIQDNSVWIHFPITGDLIKCTIKEAARNKVLLTVPPESDYYGCPDFWFNKINIIGKA